MDNSQSRKSDAAATRKRRSSILKSQRAPRAPFSELEFNVATPQDQAKSRRVSFSRRNGVAEFEINDATTAWKNVYEEHNKSLETSGNESGGARPRRVQQLGARRAQLFQDDEAELVADGEDAEPPRASLELSQLTELGAHTGDVFRLDPTACRDPTDRLDVDFSAVTPLPHADADDDLDVLHRDLDADRRANMSEYDIDVDFNATHFTLKADESDDMSITDSVHSPRVAAAAGRRLDDWAADKENIVVNPYVAPPQADHFAVGECDDVLVFDGKKCKFQSNLQLSDDDEARPSDRPRRGSDRPLSGLGAVPERASKTAFFDDGADMTMTQAVSAQILQQEAEIAYGDDERVSSDVLVTRPDPLYIIAPIQIACDDDPNMPSERAESKTEKQKTMYFDDLADISVTQTLPTNIIQREPELGVTNVLAKPTALAGALSASGAPSTAAGLAGADASRPHTDRRRTIVYGNDDGDLSVTGVLPSNILDKDETEPNHATNSGRRTTIVYGKDDCDVSITGVVPANILVERDEEKLSQASNTGRRKTIVYGNDDDNISRTGVVPAIIMVDRDNQKLAQPANTDRRKTVIYGNDDGNVSMTGVVPAHIIVNEGEANLTETATTDRRKTILYGNDDGNISVTGVVPANIMVEESAKLSLPTNTDRRKTVVFGNDDGNLSMTGVVPTNIIVDERETKLTQPSGADRRKTIVYGNDDGNISVTGVVPANIIVDERETKLTQPSGTDRRKTIVYGNDDGNISVTGVVPTNIRVDERETKLTQPSGADRRKTIVYGNDDGNISVTGVVPANIIVDERETKLTQPSGTDRRKTIVYGNDDGNISATGVVPTNIIVDERETKLTQPSGADRRKTIVYGNDDGNISVTGVVPTNIIVDERETKLTQPSGADRRKTIVYGNDDGNISVTGVVPANIIVDERETKLTQPSGTDRRKTIVYGNDDGNISVTGVVPSNIMVDRNETNEAIHTNAERRTATVAGNEDCDISATRVAPALVMVAGERKGRTKVIQPVSEDGGISMTDITVDRNQNQTTNAEHRKTFVYGNDDGNLSMTGVVPANVMLDKDGANHTQPINTERRKTIVYGNEDGDISMTGVVPADILENEDRPTHTERRKTVVYGNEDNNISMTGVVPAQIVVAKENEDAEEIIGKNDSRRKTVDYEEGDVSMTEAEPRDAPVAAHAPEHIVCYNKNDQDSIAQVPQTPSTETGDVSTKTSAAVIDRQLRGNNLTYDDLSHSDARNVSTHKSTVPEVLVYETSVRGPAALGKSVRHDEAGDDEGGQSTHAGSRDIAAETRSLTPARASAVDQTSLPSTADFASTADVQPRRAAPDRTSAIDARSDSSVSESTSMLDPMSRSSAPNRTSVFGDLPRQLALERMSLPDPPYLSSALGRNSVLDEISHALGPDRSVAFDVLSRSLALDRASMLEALSPKSALERAAAPRESPPDSVLDALLDMSSMDAELGALAAEPEPPRADSDATVTVAPAISETCIIIGDDDEPTRNVAIDTRDDVDDEAADEIEIPASEGTRTLALEYREDDMEQDEGNQTERATSCAATQADDTRALLAALSDFTDSREGDCEPRPPSAARRSLAPDRRSMVRSREDLLKDISMAQALMKTEMEQTADATELEEAEASPARREADVVKTLRFDDDSLRLDDDSPRSDDDSLHLDDDSPRSDDDSPRLLRKRASVERESRRAPVIPAYLQDVGAIKDLMDDLVKPMAGVSSSPQRAPVRSSQAQADLFPSSQVDLTAETERRRWGEAGEAPVEAGEAPVEAGEAPVEAGESPVEAERVEARARTPPPMARADAADVIVFDRRNPLNNVVLPPMAGAPHKYEPRRAEGVPAQRSPSPSHSSLPSRSPSPEREPRATQTEAPPAARPAEGGAASPPGTEQMEAVTWTGRRRSPSRVAFMLVHPPPAHAAELRKRAHMPADPRALDATPKPAVKVQKMSRLSRSSSPAARAESAAAGPRGASSASTRTVQLMLSECRLSDADAASTATLRPAAAPHESRSADSVCERGSANVVAGIDVLPFMGTECSWETRSGDAWSFRLLRARLRLCVRLAHRVQHARWAARADAPVALVVVQHAAAHHDVSDPVASWCVRLAADALQHAARDVTRAGHVPALLRHGVLVARRALRWARALHHARVVLALALQDDGRLALKVANVPLRAVWEVTMRIELVEERGAAWPRAADVRVARVVAGWAPTHEQLERLLAPLPADWGHVPRTVWKIFKYLKYKRLEDDLVLGA